MNASTRILPLKIIFGHKPRVAIDIHMKYPTEKELERDLTEEEVKEIEKCCLEFNIKQMKWLKEASIGTAKVNIQNAQGSKRREEICEIFGALHNNRQTKCR